MSSDSDTHGPEKPSLPARSDDNFPGLDKEKIRGLLRDAADRGAEAQDEGTRREYARSQRFFEEFGEEVGIDLESASLEEAAAALVAHIEQMAQAGYAASTIEKRVAGIQHYYKKSGRESPAEHRLVRRTKQNVKKTVPDDRGYGQKLPVLIKDLQQMPFDTSRLLDLRDRAILFVGFAGGLRRSEITGLGVRDLRDVEGGIVYKIRDPKGQDEPETVKIPDKVPGLNPDPNTALRSWLQAAEIDSGPLFRRVDDRWGNVSDTGSHPDTIYRVVRRWVESIGEDPDDYGSHSLRAGFATQAHLDGIPDQVAATQTRHSQVTTLHEYQRVGAVTKDHPLCQMGTESDGADS